MQNTSGSESSATPVVIEPATLRPWYLQFHAYPTDNIAYFVYLWENSMSALIKRNLRNLIEREKCFFYGICQSPSDPGNLICYLKA